MREIRVFIPEEHQMEIAAYLLVKTADNREEIPVFKIEHDCFIIKHNDFWAIHILNKGDYYCHSLSQMQTFEFAVGLKELKDRFSLTASQDIVSINIGEIFRKDSARL